MKKYHQTTIRENLHLRDSILQAIRRFFQDHNYLEIETPIRMPAPAPEAHIDAQPSGEWFLQTSPELFMKQLLSAGYSRIFQICRCFRQKERGNRHLPEFTMLEWYTSQDDYTGMMKQTEELILFVARSVKGGEAMIYRGQRIDLKPPWAKISVEAAFKRFATISMETALEQHRFHEIMACEIEPNLPCEKPVFLYDYPAVLGALARLKPENPAFAERFELYIGGMELCNAFSELTDSKKQRQRFEKEIAFRKKAGKKHYPMPEKFLNALKDMPDATGNALGVDRLVMLFADAHRIDDIVAFSPEEL